MRTCAIDHEDSRIEEVDPRRQSYGSPTAWDSITIPNIEHILSGMAMLVSSMIRAELPVHVHRNEVFDADTLDAVSNSSTNAKR